MTAYECPSCHTVTPHVTGLCPVCGHIGPGRAVTRGASIERGVAAMRLLRKPHTTGGLADALGVSRDTAERVLAALKRAGVKIHTHREGREAWHRVTRGTP